MLTLNELIYLIKRPIILRKGRFNLIKVKQIFKKLQSDLLRKYL